MRENHRMINNKIDMKIEFENSHFFRALESISNSNINKNKYNIKKY